MEKTWLAEQAAEKEKQKLEQLRKEIRQEKSMEELVSLKDPKYQHFSNCINFVEAKSVKLIGCIQALLLQ